MRLLDGVNSTALNGLIRFAVSEIAPKLNGWPAGVIYAALIASRPDATIEALKAAAQKNGEITLRLPPFGAFAFCEEDFAKLEQYTAEASAIIKEVKAAKAKKETE